MGNYDPSRFFYSTSLFWGVSCDIASGGACDSLYPWYYWHIFFELSRRSLAVPVGYNHARNTSAHANIACK